MLKIVDIHTSNSAAGEYVVLQNQGLTTVTLRGWALCTETYLYGDAHEAASGMHIFADDVAIKPYTRVVLFTGTGENGWHPTVDGKFAYLVYWGRQYPIWSTTESIQLLNVASSRRVAPARTEDLQLIGV